MRNYIIANIMGSTLIGATCALFDISFVVTIIAGVSYFALITYIKQHKEINK